MIRHRWDGSYKDEAEGKIASETYWSFVYAMNVLQSRWDGPSKDLAESMILKAYTREWYLKFLREHDVQNYAAFHARAKRQG